MTYDLQEWIARAIYESRNGRGCRPWPRQTKAHKAPYLVDASAAIKSLCNLVVPAGGSRRDPVDLCRRLRAARLFDIEHRGRMILPESSLPKEAAEEIEQLRGDIAQLLAEADARAQEKQP